MILSFSNRKPRGITIPAYPFVIWIALFDLSSFSKSAGKLDFQDIRFTVTDPFGYINSIRDEHVICPQNYVTIESHARDRIEAIESQHNFGVWFTLSLGDARKLDFVDPSPLVHPPTLKRITIEKWIRDSG